MSDGSDSGGADPRSPEQSTGDVEKAEKDHVPMEAGALLALVHEDKPGNQKPIFRSWCYENSLAIIRKLKRI